MIKISVAIITKDRWSLLSQCLASLLSQTVKLDELIIIDGSKSNSLQKKMANFSANADFLVSYYKKANIGRSAARNAAIRKAKYSWLAFLDDDCLPAIDWYQQLKISFKNKNIVPTKQKKVVLSIKNNQNLTCGYKWQVLIGAVSLSPKANFWQMVEHFEKKSWVESTLKGNSITDLEVLDTKNILYNKIFLQKNKIYFDEELNIKQANICEDSDFGMQLESYSAKAIYQNQILVYHLARSSNIFIFFKKRFQYFNAHRFYEQKWASYRLKYKKNLLVRIKLLYKLILKEAPYKYQLQKAILFLLIISYLFIEQIIFRIII